MMLIIMFNVVIDHISQRAPVDSRNEEHYGISGNNVGSGFLSCRQKLATVTKPGSVTEPSYMVNVLYKWWLIDKEGGVEWI